MSTSLFRGWGLVSEAPPSQGENQVVTLRSPTLTPTHEAIVLDCLATHAVKRRRAETEIIGALHELNDLWEADFEWRRDYVDHALFAILGGYGAGKTTLAVVLFILTCMRNWRTAAYGGDHPRAYAIAPTGPVLADTVIHRFEAVCPTALVMRKVRAPWSVELPTGGVVAGKSADGANEGFEGFAFYAEEIQHENYWRDPMLWPNYCARVRDPHAAVRRIIVAGLPQAGNVRGQFDKPGVHLFHLATAGNPGIDEANMEQIRQACPAGQEEALLGGDWMQPLGAVFPNYNARTHLLPGTAYDPKLPVHLSLDVGNHSNAVLFQARPVTMTGITGQRSKGLGVLVVDEVVTRKKSVEDTCLAVRLSDYELSAGSVICVDPTIRFDERNVIAKYFPGLSIVQLDKNDPYYFVEEGIRLMQAALGDALGNVRIHILENLRLVRDGCVTALQSAKRHPKTGEVTKDDRTDHARDALRYAVCWALGKRGGPQVKR